MLPSNVTELASHNEVTDKQSDNLVMKEACSFLAPGDCSKAPKAFDGTLRRTCRDCASPSFITGMQIMQAPQSSRDGAQEDFATEVRPRVRRGGTGLREVSGRPLQAVAAHLWQLPF